MLCCIYDNVKGIRYIKSGNVKSKNRKRYIATYLGQADNGMESGHQLTNTKTLSHNGNGRLSPINELSIPSTNVKVFVMTSSYVYIFIQTEYNPRDFLHLYNLEYLFCCLKA